MRKIVQVKRKILQFSSLGMLHSQSLILAAAHRLQPNDDARKTVVRKFTQYMKKIGRKRLILQRQEWTKEAVYKFFVTSPIFGFMKIKKNFNGYQRKSVR